MWVNDNLLKATLNIKLYEINPILLSEILKKGKNNICWLLCERLML